MHAHDSYLESSDNACNSVDDINKQLDDVRLQDADVPVVGLLDENKEQDQRNDADNQKQDATEESFMSLGTIHLRSQNRGMGNRGSGQVGYAADYETCSRVLF